MTVTLTRKEIGELIGDTVYSSDGEKIGTVTDVFYDVDSNQQRWMGVHGGLLNLKHRTVPLDGAELRGDSHDEVWVPYTKQQILDAPEHYGDDLDDNSTTALGDHYGLDWDEYNTTGRGDFVGRENEFDKTDGVVRHEEELAVGKREVEAGRVRLRKWVETEPVSEDVTLKRETATVERERLDQPVSNASFQDQAVEVELNREEPVVAKQAYAKERVALDKGVIADRETVTDTVRKERVEVEGEGALETDRDSRGV